MALTGLEIEMLPLGNADCILATGWESNLPKRVLIDGGNKKDAQIVRAFLARNGINYIDHVVCSHSHDDHAGGLLELAKDKTLYFGAAWMHLPFEKHHGLFPSFEMYESYKRSARGRELLETLETIENLTIALADRNIPIYEPFLNTQIGFLTVCGPTPAYYKELMIKLLEPQNALARLTGLLEMSNSESTTTSLDDNPSTSHENNCCPILATAIQGKKVVLTADAGVQALTAACGNYDLAQCDWLQIPHHGSRRNMSPALVNYLAPRTAYISSEGSLKHPSRAVVNAFKNAGAEVYSTHYPTETYLYYRIGQTPTRPHYGPITPLWE